jgi:hypothetical protein
VACLPYYMIVIPGNNPQAKQPPQIAICFLQI